jgi:tetratricopeptide (TPR) repeat protein
MLTYHKTDELMGKVSKSILDKYRFNYENTILSSIIAGFHMTYGFIGEGLSMSMEIVNSIKDGTEIVSDRNILVWTLYNLSEELINEGNYDIALKFIERAEKNWSRDVMLGDDIGVYHVSWIEQIWLRKAKIYLMTEELNKFEMLTDNILLNRFEFFNNAQNYTGETIIGDRCTYTCFEIMASERKKRNHFAAINLIKQAIMHKGVYLNKKYYYLSEKYEKMEPYQRAFNLYSRFYYRLPNSSYDCIQYGYCKSCREYNKDYCNKKNIKTNERKACSNYLI